MNHDHSSFAKDRATPAPAPLDWPRLVATLAAHQASSRTARVAMRIDGPDRPVPAADAFVDVIEGNRGWTAAATAMAGRFHAGSSDEAWPKDGGPQR